MRTPLYEGRFVSVVRDEETGHEIVLAPNCAGVLIYVEDMDAVVLVRQHRPAIAEQAFEGLSMENPGGRCDQTFTPQEVMAKEALEEAGVHVDPARIELLNHGKPVANSPGILTQCMYFGFARVRSSALESDQKFGVTNEGERTVRHLVQVSQLRTMVFDSMTTMVLVEWFLAHRAPKTP